MKFSNFSFPRETPQYGVYLFIVGYLVIQTLFPYSDTVFKDDNASIRAVGIVQSRSEEHEGEFKHFPRPVQIFGNNDNRSKPDSRGN